MKTFFYCFLLISFITAITGCSLGSSEKEMAISEKEMTINEVTYTPKALVSGEDTQVQLSFDLEGGSTNRECTLILPNSEISSFQTSDEFSINISEDTGVSLVCADDENTVSRRILLRAADMPEITDFKAYPSLIHTGVDNTVLLSWNIEHTYPLPKCTVNGVEADNKYGHYSHKFENVTSATSYALVCDNEAGSVSENITVVDVASSIDRASGDNIFTVGPSGGTFQWNNITMEVPAGALAETVEITQKSGIHVNDMTNLLVSPFSFEPEGLIFHQPVSISIDYNPLDFHGGGHTDFHQSHIQAGIINDGSFAKKSTHTSESNASFNANKLESFYLTSSKDSTQPFRAGTINLIERNEAVVFTDKEVQFIDDEATGYSTLSDREAMLGEGSLVEAGDVDRDGKDEVVAGYINNGNLFFRTFEYDGNAIVRISYLEATKNIVVTDFDFAIYDIDNDAKNELIYTYTQLEEKYDDDRIRYYDFTSVMKIASYDNTDGWVTYEDEAISGIQFENTGKINIAAGNIDGDSDAEIVIFGANIEKSKFQFHQYGMKPIYVYPSNGFLSILHVNTENEGNIKSVTYTENDHGYIRLKNGGGNFDLLVDNFDTDDISEVAFTCYNDNLMHIIVYDDLAAEKPFQFLGKAYADTDKYINYSWNTPGGTIKNMSDGTAFFPDKYIQSRAGDFNGDRIKEIVIPIAHDTNFGIQPLVFSLNNSELDQSMQYFADLTLPFTEYSGTMGISSKYFGNAAFTVGDLDTDGKDELFVLQVSGEDVYKTILDTKMLDDGYRQKYGFGKTEHHKVYGSNMVTAVVGDFDGDNIKVHYTGKSEINTLDPVVSVVVAAPPNWNNEEIQEELHLTETSYGTEVSAGTSKTHETGFTTKVSIGVDAETPFWKLASLEVMAGWEHESMKSETTKKVTSYGTSYTTDHAHNYVVFTTPTYVSYLYEVLSHDDIENIKVAEDGKRYMMINIPMASNTYKWEFAEFQEHNDDLIDEDVFTHQIGNPYSYRSESEKNTLIEASIGVCRDEQDDDENTIDATCGFESKQYMQVGNGYALTKTMLKYEEENMTENKTADTFSVESKACINMYCLALEGAYTNASIYEISAGNAMEFEGSVSDIVPDYYSDHSYGYKLFTYFRENSDAQKFLVIDYSVERSN